MVPLPGIGIEGHIDFNALYYITGCLARNGFLGHRKWLHLFFKVGLSSSGFHLKQPLFFNNTLVLGTILGGGL